MYKILITTYQRPELLRLLLQDIKREGFEGHIYIVNDGSPQGYEWVKYLPNVDYHLNPENNGKKGYWKTVTTLFEKLKGADFGYVWMLPDDYRLAPGFFEKSINIWESISDDNKIALNTNLIKGRTKNWTNFEPVWTDFGPIEKYAVLHTQWVDMCFLAKRRFFEELNYKIDQVPISRWEQYPNFGSGVGHQISLYLYAKNLNMYHASPSLCIISDLPSVMNPQERINNPAISQHDHS